MENVNIKYPWSETLLTIGSASLSPWLSENVKKSCHISLDTSPDCLILTTSHHLNTPDSRPTNKDVTRPTLRPDGGCVIIEWSIFRDLKLGKSYLLTESFTSQSSLCRSIPEDEVEANAF